MSAQRADHQHARCRRPALLIVELIVLYLLMAVAGSTTSSTPALFYSLPSLLPDTLGTGYTNESSVIIVGEHLLPSAADTTAAAVALSLRHAASGQNWALEADQSSLVDLASVLADNAAAGGAIGLAGGDGGGGGYHHHQPLPSPTTAATQAIRVVLPAGVPSGLATVIAAAPTSPSGAHLYFYSPPRWANSTQPFPRPLVVADALTLALAEPGHLDLDPQEARHATPAIRLRCRNATAAAVATSAAAATVRTAVLPAAFIPVSSTGGGLAGIRTKTKTTSSSSSSFSSLSLLSLLENVIPTPSATTDQPQELSCDVDVTLNGGHNYHHATGAATHLRVPVPVKAVFVLLGRVSDPGWNSLLNGLRVDLSARYRPFLPSTFVDGVEPEALGELNLDKGVRDGVMQT